MGFSLGFYPIEGDAMGDADRAALAAFLAERGLRINPETDGLVHLEDGERLRFDGSWTDLRLDALDHDEPVTAALSHATLAPEELEFVFALCSAGRLMIVNMQGGPMYLGLDGIHTRGMFPDPDDAVLIRDAKELATALGGSFDHFSDFRARVLATE